MTTFANAQETIAHMNAQFAKYGEAALTVWLTAEGKFIDVLVLEALVAEGKVTRTGGSGLSAYSTPTYGLACPTKPGMTITVTDQTSTPTCTCAFRAELFDAHNIPAAVGYGDSEAEAIGDAWECLLDSLECEARLALAAAS